jgi:hypothetical protein
MLENLIEEALARGAPVALDTAAGTRRFCCSANDQRQFEQNEVRDVTSIHWDI